MINKKRIFDIVLSYNDSEILNARYEYLKDTVDYFIFIKFDKCDFIENENITAIYFDDYYYNFNEPDFRKIIDFLNENFDFNPDDIFLFSKSFEIPKKDDLETCISELSIFPVFLDQVSFMWDTNFYSKISSIGGFIFRYSHFLTIKKLYEFMSSTSRNPTFTKTIIKCGWNLSTFCSLNDFIKNSLFWNNLGASNYEIIDSYSTNYDFRGNKNFKNESIEIPKVFESLTHSPVLRENLKIIISDDIDNFNDENYKILISDDQKEIGDFITYNIKYPSNILYGEKPYHQFKEDFKKNETLRILSTFKLLDLDEIIIKIKSKQGCSDFKCFYQELLKGVPSEMF